MKNLGLMTKAAGAALVLAAGLMTGCDSSGGSSTKTAQFVDSTVVGIGFKTATQSGTTDEDGKFKYKGSETVTFFVGDIELPAGIPSGGYITPAHLAGTADWEESDAAINIIRFLLTIDEDGDAENGIQIPEGAAEFATESVDFFVDIEDFEFEVGEFFGILDEEELFTYEYEGIVDAETAEGHFTATIKALGIKIEIVQVSGACTAAKLADISGDYRAAFEKTTGSPQYANDDGYLIEINAGGGLRVDDESIASSCTFADNTVKVDGIPSINIYVYTWLNGKDIYALTSTGGELSLLYTENAGDAIGSFTDFNFDIK